MPSNYKNYPSPALLVVGGGTRRAWKGRSVTRWRAQGRWPRLPHSQPEQYSKHDGSVSSRQVSFWPPICSIKQLRSKLSIRCTHTHTRTSPHTYTHKFDHNCHVFLDAGVCVWTGYCLYSDTWLSFTLLLWHMSFITLCIKEFIQANIQQCKLWCWPVCVRLRVCVCVCVCLH